MNLIQRARDTGRCPPSLLSAERVVNDDGFETAVLELMEPAMPGTHFSVGFLRAALDARLECASRASILTMLCLPLMLVIGMSLGTDEKTAAKYEEVLKVSFDQEASF